MPTPWSLDRDLDQAVDPAYADRDPGVVRRVGDRVVDQVADGRREQLARRRTPWLRRPGDTASVMSCAEATSRQRSTASVTTASTAISSGSCSVSATCSRDRSTISLTSWVSRTDSPCIRSANRRTASGSSLASSDRLGQQGHPADRRLELVADVGDEVAAHLLDPAGLGAVLDQQQHVRAAERRDPRADDQPAAAERPAGQLQLALPDHAVAAHRPGQLEQLGVGDLVAADQPVGVRRRAGLDHGVGAVHDDRAGAQDGQDVEYAGGQRRLPAPGGTVVLGPLGQPHRQHGRTHRARLRRRRPGRRLPSRPQLPGYARKPAVRRRRGARPRALPLMFTWGPGRVHAPLAGSDRGQAGCSLPAQHHPRLDLHR